MAKTILDACCGTRMFWFDKSDERVVYLDKRRATRIIDVGTAGTKGRSPKSVEPDVLSNFRNMPFANDTFWHVVFDPPHFYKRHNSKEGKSESRFAFDYGLLSDNWKIDLRLGFSECFRVLKPNGTLIFKWCEAEIPLKDILCLAPVPPLYGHRSGKKAQTHWVAFTKPNTACTPTASGVGTQTAIPLQATLFADVLSATHGGG